MWDSYEDLRPTAFENTMWVSSNPEISFYIAEKEPENIYGQVIINGVEKKLKFFFNRGVSVYIYIYNEETNEYTICLKGTCEFDVDMCVVKIDKKCDSLFTGKYETIVFNKLNPTDNYGFIAYSYCVRRN